MHVYFTDQSYTSNLYEDAGDYFDYEQGNYMIRTFTQTGDLGKRQSHVRQLRKGRYNAEYPRLRFILHAFPFTPTICRCDDTEYPIVRNKETDRLEVVVPKNFTDLYFNA